MSSSEKVANQVPDAGVPAVIPAIQPTTVRPTKEHIIAAFVMFLMTLMFTGHNVKALFWVPFIPLIFIVWVLRARTEITEKGIRAVYLFRPSKSLNWDMFSGIRFNKSGKAFAAGTDDTEFTLPGVSFNSLPQLSEKTLGIIPDPVTPAENELHQKVQVVHKDGYAVLMDEEEYAEYEKQRQEEYRATHGSPESEETDEVDDVENVEETGKN